MNKYPTVIESNRSHCSPDIFVFHQIAALTTSSIIKAQEQKRDLSLERQNPELIDSPLSRIEENFDVRASIKLFSILYLGNSLWQ